MKNALSLLLALACLGALPAWGDAPVSPGRDAATGSGFGKDARALTVQSMGNSGFSESSCIAPASGGGFSSDPSGCEAGYLDIGGNEASPMDFPQQSATPLSSVGVTGEGQRSSGAENYSFFSTSPVPEPSALLLLGTGLFSMAGISFLRRRPAKLDR